MYENGGVNPRQPMNQDLSVSPNINASRATDFQNILSDVCQHFVASQNNHYYNSVY